MEMPCAGSMMREVESVPRRSPGKGGRKGRRPAFEIGARAENRIRIDHHPSIAECVMLAAGRWHDRLIINAGVRHQDTERFERSNQSRFDLNHRVALLQTLVCVEVDPTWVSDGRNANASIAFR